MHGKTLLRGAQLQTLFSFNSDFSSSVVLPSQPPGLFPPSPPQTPPTPNQPSLLSHPLCLASNHFFLALISSCRAASNQEIMGPRAQQGTLPGRGLRPRPPGQGRNSGSLGSPTPAPVLVLVISSPGQEGGWSPPQLKCCPGVSS